jgi:hypothetical protein
MVDRQASIAQVLGVTDAWHVGPSVRWPLVVVDEAHTFVHERKGTSGSARITPGTRATCSAAAAGITLAVVNGPDAPSATTHRSAWTLPTIRRVSLWKLAFTPANSSVIANTSPVAATAIVNRRRRHCRSRG